MCERTPEELQRTPIGYETSEPIGLRGLNLVERPATGTHHPVVVLGPRRGEGEERRRHTITSAEMERRARERVRDVRRRAARDQVESVENDDYVEWRRTGSGARKINGNTDAVKDSRGKDARMSRRGHSVVASGGSIFGDQGQPIRRVVL